MDEEMKVQEETKAIALPKNADLAELMLDDNVVKRFQWLASSNLIPEAYKNKPQDVMVAYDMARRTGQSLMGVLQSLYVVKGKPSWSGKACIAMINSSGLFTRLRFKWLIDEKQNIKGCYAWAKDLQTGELLEGAPITEETVKKFGWKDKSGSMWAIPGQERQMYMYRAAEYFANVYCPELLSGMYTIESQADIDGYDAEYVEVIQNDN